MYFKSKSPIPSVYLTIDQNRSVLVGIRSPNLLIFRKKICCGTIFVSPRGEAIMDPRFLTKCSAHQGPDTPPAPPPVPLPKIDNPLFTIEKIIESELKTFAASSSSSSSGEESKSVSPVSRKPVSRSSSGLEVLSRSSSGQIGEDADEGFYDKPSISPTNSID